MRIAVASSDGMTVNQHFGSATQFLIYNIDQGRRIELVEVRKAEKNQDLDRDPQGDEIGRRLKLLSDCRAIVCLRAGQGISDREKRNRIKLYETGAIIWEALSLCYHDLKNEED